jgi:hypothetical protein
MLYVEIRIEGSLDPHWSSWFEDLALVPVGAESLLAGRVADQAALYGLLARLRDLAIPLRGVDSLRLDEPAGAGGGVAWGGGWGESPAGACPDRPALAGRVKFSFGVRWEPGGAGMAGRVRFHFPAAGLSFMSVTLEHAEAEGAQVRCRGLGCLNAQGRYRFWLNVLARSAAEGGAGWRLKLAAPDGQTVVYDNEPGRSETAAPRTALAAGQIVFCPAGGRVNADR